MSGNMKRPRKQRSRKSVPMILPADLYDYADDHPQSRSASRASGDADPSIDRMAVVDDWPEFLPVTEAEVDVFERYFGDVLDRLFSAAAAEHSKPALPSLTPDVNNRP
ncbi:hypothetical protein C3941_02640 [Kaistia algarum]|uniref:hypothetical protein n=1 Tax=Kaistia algarum TaxID=2083279 RepID=UPI000CE7E78C|nr:hypothetical protein [Kaistia algarum]MCX5512889.1 hypothetical protein [Kaistia algarum]PPE81622.1 hypothetical protein C3941_02640 [Kaistia algarum]